MFAFRLAALMGRLDVDAMLHEITPEQLTEWAAAWLCGLFREQWLQAGAIAAEVHNGFCDIRAGLNDNSITKESYRYPQDYDPTQPSKKKTRKANKASIDAAERRLRVRYGDNRKNRDDTG